MAPSAPFNFNSVRDKFMMSFVVLTPSTTVVKLLCGYANKKYSLS